MMITIGISSGIAAYKVLSLITLLKNDGHEVQVILTPSATHMISMEDLEEMTGNKVYSELFEENFDYKEILKRRTVDHIEVATNTDLFVIAPATANIIGKMANGIADDFLTTTLLATQSQVLICPSMNTVMWHHPAFQRNLQTIKSFGYHVIDPTSGPLACGTEGVGRLPEPEGIYAEIKELMKYQESLKGKKIIVTAGGTSEPIDEARVITNKSTGKMGIALAEECHKRGAEVLLIRSSTAVKSTFPIKQITFETASSLEKVIKEHIKANDIIFHVAAVSDYTVDAQEGKIDSAESISLELIPTNKIINEIKKWNPKIKLIAFKAVSGINGQTFEKVKEKMDISKADAMIVNDISRSDIAFGADANEVHIVFKDGRREKIEKKSKNKIAKEIISTIIKRHPEHVSGSIN